MIDRRSRIAGGGDPDGSAGGAGDLPRGIDHPPAGPGDPTCPHSERDAGVCIHCGHCDHELILNGACYFCGTTDLDPIALSPKKPTVIPPDQLVRKKRH